MSRELIITLPDDPAEAQAALIERLAQIAEEQAELSALLDEQRIPAHDAGRRLTFHERVAVLSGFYGAVVEMLAKSVA